MSSIDPAGSSGGRACAGNTVSSAAALDMAKAFTGEATSCVRLISAWPENDVDRGGLTSETTTTAPAVAPIAAAMAVARKLRRKPGIGAK